jgi:hypothetical protein
MFFIYLYVSQVPGSNGEEVNNGQSSSRSSTPSGGHRGWSMVRNLIKRPSSRLSEAESHDLTLSQPPKQLMERLMSAGMPPGGSSNREGNRPKVCFS